MYDVGMMPAALVLALALWIAGWWVMDLASRWRIWLEMPGGFWSNLRNELHITFIHFAEANVLGVRPGRLWGAPGATGGGMVIDEVYKAENDLSAKQYYFMEISANNQVDVCDGATDVGCGVLQNKPTASQNAIVRHFGVSKVNSDAALTAGNLIGPASDGQADAKTAGSDTTEYVSGVVTRGSGAAGEMAEALICGVPHRAA